ncbi:PxKF domain-containing protein [Microbacterium sp. PRC9]|uniref:PxKF domain-containing protein n=1 Tax=Microbacterium sp. PRC9 TaxID=2962591 RepID=UPI002880D14E|nr:PxKF domain-containing protein [Microbacterium sp. PRC9]MDT0143000.1 PxKF domain-containing protein [Microbacterium sp. PRC9]
MSALLISTAGAAHADNLEVDGDALVTNTQAEINFGNVACGTTATKQVTIYVQRLGNGQVFKSGALVDITATTSAPLAVSVATGTAGDIELPSNWTTDYPNNTPSTTSAAATVTLTAGTTAGTFSGSVVFSGTGAALQEKPQDPASITRSATVTARWTVECAAKTDTTTSLNCPSSAVYTAGAITPCTAKVTGENGFEQTLNVTYGSNTAVGTATAAASYAGDATHKASNASASFQIAKASTTTTVTCPPSAVTYTGSPQTPCTASVSGPGLVQNLTPAYSDNTNAGTASATASFAGDGNLLGSSDTKNFVILAADASCEVEGYVGIYDGAVHGATGSCTGLGGADVSHGLELGEWYTDVPGGPAHWSFELPNYVTQTGSVGIAIGKAMSSIELQCSDTVYNRAAQETCSATVTGAGGLSEPVTITYGDNTDAGTATAKAEYAGDNNHEGSVASATFTIAQAPTTTTVTCTGPNTYTGVELTPCTVKVTADYGIVEPPTPSTPSYLNNRDAGTASASYQYPGDDNHLPSNDSTTFTIDKATSSITLSCPASVVFTGSPLTPCTAIVSGVALADTGVRVIYSANTNAGSVTTSASWPGDDNHTGSTANGGFEILKAPVTVTVACPTAAIPFTGSPIQPCTAWVKGPGGLDEAVTPVTYSGNMAVSTPMEPATAKATYVGDANHLGGEGTATFQIEAWKLNGFYKPVDMGDTVLNIVKGGSTVPLKFTVLAGTTEVTDVTTLHATFAITPIPCDPKDAVSDDLFATTGGTTLRYDATAHQWIQNWATPKIAGKCYQVTLTTADGSTLKAQFKTK